MHNRSDPTVDSLMRQTHDSAMRAIAQKKRFPMGTLVAIALALPLASFHMADDAISVVEPVTVNMIDMHQSPTPEPASVAANEPHSVVHEEAIVPIILEPAIPVPPREMTLEEKRLLRKAQRHVAMGFPIETLDMSPPSPVVTRINPYNKVGVFLTPSSTGREKFLDDTLDDLIASTGDALVFDAKGSFVYFDAIAPVAEDLELENPAYDLSEVIAKAHEKGVYTIARFVAIKDAGLTSKLPETRVRHPQSNQVISREWIDPENEKALAYNMEAICNLAAAGIDEINLDYIRFSTSEFGALLAYSTEEKAKKVSTFITRARETINRCNPATKLGLSTYAILGWSYDVNVRTLGQDVVSFAPLVDVISPMAYPATFTTDAYYDPQKHPVSRMHWLVYRTLTGYKELLGPEHAHKLRPWIQGYGVTHKNMSDQIKAVFDANTCGFTVWNADNAYATAYRGIKAMERPAECR